MRLCRFDVCRGSAPTSRGPQPSRGYAAHSGRSPEETFVAASAYVYQCYKTGRDLFHRNIRRILVLCFPGLEFDQQMRQVWITDSVLCSAAVEGGTVPVAASRACRSRYLEAQIALLPNALVAALGQKAQHRLAGLSRTVVPAVAAAPPGCNRADALASWQAIANRLSENRR